MPLSALTKKKKIESTALYLNLEQKTDWAKKEQFHQKYDPQKVKQEICERTQAFWFNVYA